MSSKLHVAVVGLNFGGDFAPIYHLHPDVRKVTICDSKPGRIAKVAERYHIRHSSGSLDEVLADPDIDAVHLLTGIPDHARQSVAVLESGKHCACAVPAATSLEELNRLVEAQERSGRRYMMMETGVFDRAFLHVQDLHRADTFGHIQMVRGAYYQDMEGWPSYWRGLPPMWYATHSVGPCLALLGTGAELVHCFGSGRMREELQTVYHQPYPMETAIARLRGHDAALEITRSLFHGAHPYTEQFSVYGDHRCFEWQQIEEEDPVLYTLAPLGKGTDPRPTSAERIPLPDFADRLPPEIAPFTQPGIYRDDDPEMNFECGGGHGGSHPHLVHEFVRAIVEDRPSFGDAKVAAEWCALGICAHESAMRGGEGVVVPRYT